MQRYSGFNLLARALRGHRHWAPAWRDPEPKKHYDVVIIGAGGHGLATAYYLASRHGIRDVAVIERHHLGSGNSGRNTQICRSNYFHLEASAFYEHSLKLYEGLGRELNFNIMFGQQGLLTVFHDRDEADMNRRWLNAMALNGIETELLDRAAVARMAPLLNLDGRYPVLGGFLQRRAGIARHDAVVWAYARAAAAHGVDIVQHCEVTGFRQSDSRIQSLQTSRGDIGARRVVMCVAGSSSVLAARAGFRLPVRSIPLQAMVTEPVKPVLDCVLSSNLIHFYVSQSDRGELVIGGASDYYDSYAQRGALPATLDNAGATVEMLPCLAGLRIMRQWAGVCDIAPDASPILGPSPIENLFLSTGWGTGGFKAIPAGGDTLAWTVANERVHPLLEPFTLERFTRGSLVDEAAAAGVAH